MDAGAASWLMLGSLRIPLLAEATNVRAIVAASIVYPVGTLPICARAPVETTE